jgi:hypothetical protein
MFNLTKLVCTSTLFFKESNNFDFEISSLIIFSVACIFYLIIIFKYAKNPSSLGCFYTSFNSEKTLAKIHYFLYTIVISASIILMTLFPKMIWLALIPLFIMCIYILFYKPYLHDKENYRSSFNFFVKCCWICLSIIC